VVSLQLSRITKISALSQQYVEFTGKIPMSELTVSLNPSEFAKTLSCGSPVTFVGPNSAVEIWRLECRRWSCERCRDGTVNQYRWKITLCFEGLAGPHLYVKDITKSAKELSNFLQRQTRGAFVCIRTAEETAVVVATRQFLKDKGHRRDKRKYLKDELPKLLDAAWPGGKRISCSVEINSLWRTLSHPSQHRQLWKRLESEGLTKGEISDVWGRWQRDWNTELRVYWAAVPGRYRWEFSHLQTPQEQAKWLSDKWRGNARILKEGESFIEQMLGLYFYLLNLGHQIQDRLVISYCLEQICHLAA